MTTKTATPEKGKAEGAPKSSPKNPETVLTAVVQSIEDKIEYYQKKQELIKRFHSLETSSTVLADQMAAMAKETEEDVFLSDQFKLTLTVKSGYSSEREILTFRNPQILSELLAFMQSKITAKLDQVALEITN